MCDRTVNDADEPAPLASGRVREDLEGILEPDDLDAIEEPSRWERQAEMLARADRLLVARERFGLGLGVPPRTFEALADVTDRLLRLLADQRPGHLGSGRRRIVPSRPRRPTSGPVSQPI